MWFILSAESERHPSNEGNIVLVDMRLPHTRRLRHSSARERIRGEGEGNSSCFAVFVVFSNHFLKRKKRMYINIHLYQNIGIDKFRYYLASRDYFIRYSCRKGNNRPQPPSSFCLECSIFILCPQDRIPVLNRSPKEIGLTLSQSSPCRTLIYFRISIRALQL